MVRSASAQRKAQPSFTDVAAISAEDHAWELLLKISGATAKLGADNDAMLRAAHAELGALALEGHRLLTPVLNDSKPEKRSARKRVEKASMLREPSEEARMKEEERLARRKAEEEVALRKAQKKEEEAACKREEEIEQKKLDEELLQMKARYDTRKKEQEKQVRDTNHVRAAKDGTQQKEEGAARLNVRGESYPSVAKEQLEQMALKEKVQMVDEGAQPVRASESKESLPATSGLRGAFRRIISIVSAGVEDVGNDPSSNDSCTAATVTAPAVGEEEPSKGGIPADGCEQEENLPNSCEQEENLANRTEFLDEAAQYANEVEVDAESFALKSSSRIMNKRARGQRRDQLRAQRPTSKEPIAHEVNTLQSTPEAHRDESIVAEAIFEDIKVSGVRQPRGERKTAESLSAKRKKNLQSRCPREGRDWSLSSTTTPDAADSIDHDEREIFAKPDNAKTRANDSGPDSEPEIQIIAPCAIAWEELLRDASSHDEADWVIFELLRDTALIGQRKKGR